MKKTLAAVLAALPIVLFAASASAADARVSAERRALKPSTGLDIVDTTIQLSVGAGWEKDPKGGRRRSGGWQPTRLKFDLWGKSDDANAIVVVWKNGNKVLGSTTCPAPKISDTEDKAMHEWDDQSEVICDVKEGDFSVPKVGTYSADVSYRAAGKADQLLRTLSFTVRSTASNDTKYAEIGFYVDHDYKLSEAVAYWDWDAGSLHLRTYTKQGGDFNPGSGKLKCSVDGKELGQDGDVSFGGANSFSVRDGAHDRETKWVAMEGAIYKGRDSGVWKPGKYECQMILQAKVMRVLRFQLSDKLAIVTGAEQQSGKVGAFSSRTTLLADFDIPLGVDQPFDRRAFDKQAFLGRTWLNNAPKLAAGVGGNYIEPSPAIAAKAGSKGSRAASAGRKGKKKH